MVMIMVIVIISLGIIGLRMLQEASERQWPLMALHELYSEFILLAYDPRILAPQINIIPPTYISEP